mgnify:CR=1 FL=1
MRILIFGNGQFAEWYKEILPSKGHTVTIATNVDICDEAAVQAAITKHEPEVVINTAAKTNLDWCEQNRLACFNTNVLGTDTVAEVVQNAGLYLVHISTGCIQESTTATEVHTEEDPANPTSFYSWSKYWADQLLLSRTIRSGLKVLILRPRQPVSGKASNRNALVKMLTFNKFIDTPNSITVLEDFISITEQLISRNITGLYNVANAGVTSPFKIAQLLKEFVSPNLEIQLISKDELNRMTLAKRIDSVLDCSKLAALGITLKTAEERLREILPQLKADLDAHPEMFMKTKDETIAKLALRTS